MKNIFIIFRNMETPFSSEPVRAGLRVLKSLAHEAGIANPDQQKIPNGGKKSPLLSLSIRHIHRRNMQRFDQYIKFLQLFG